jgi:hypothetical protein
MDEALHEEADTAFIGDGIISVFGAAVAFEECANRRDVRPDLTSIASNVPARAVSALPMSFGRARFRQPRRKKGFWRTGCAGQVCVERSGERWMDSAAEFAATMALPHRAGVTCDG